MNSIKYNIALFLIRLITGSVFLSEGIQKFLFPDKLGVGRFINIGLPYPEFFGVLVPSFEIACGIAVLIGLFTRLAAIPLVIIMLVAIITTKIPILLNQGFWMMAHEARTDWAMLMTSIVLLITSGGKYSMENYFPFLKGKKR